MGQIRLTNRGFRVMSFSDTYGSDCSIQESSNILPRVWLGVDKDFDGRDSNSHRMHLDQGQAWQIAQLLLYFAEHGDLPEQAPDIPEKYQEKEE